MSKKYYILEQEHYNQFKETTYYTFDIILVDDSGAHVVDSNYRSITEAKEAWPEAIEPK